MVVTPGQSEGPFYPLESDLYEDIDNDLVKIESVTREAGGEVLQLSGVVKTVSDSPVKNAIVEIWQCDVNGRYIHRYDRSSSNDKYFQGLGKTIPNELGNYNFRAEVSPISWTVYKES